MFGLVFSAVYSILSKIIIALQSSMGIIQCEVHTNRKNCVESSLGSAVKLSVFSAFECSVFNGANLSVQCTAYSSRHGHLLQLSSPASKCSKLARVIEFSKD